MNIFSVGILIPKTLHKQPSALSASRGFISVTKIDAAPARSYIESAFEFAAENPTTFLAFFSLCISFIVNIQSPEKGSARDRMVFEEW